MYASCGSWTYDPAAFFQTVMIHRPLGEVRESSDIIPYTIGLIEKRSLVVRTDPYETAY